MTDDIVVASPAGGPIPVDQNSLTGDFLTKAAKDFLLDPVAMGKLFHSVKLDTIDFSTVNGMFLSAGKSKGCVAFELMRRTIQISPWQ